MIHTFSGFELDERCCELRWLGEPLKIEPKALSALVYLVRHRDRVVTKDELLRKLWPSESVTDSSLTYCIHMVRKALDHGPIGKHAIRTFHRRGYRFVAPLEPTSDVAPPGRSPPSPPPHEGVLIGGRAAEPDDGGPALLAIRLLGAGETLAETASRRAHPGSLETQQALRAVQLIGAIEAPVYEHRGRDLESLDGCFVARLPSVSDAVACAFAVRRNIRQYVRASNTDAVGVCMGLHRGPVVPRDGADGGAVGRAIALCRLAEDGQCLASHAVRGAAAVPRDFRLLARPAQACAGPGGAPLVYEVTPPEPPSVAGALGDALSTRIPLVGRDGELRRLCEVVESARNGRGAAVLMPGEAGVGKTRLVSELTAYAAYRGLSVFSGACYEAGGALAYGPFAEALGALVESVAEPALEAAVGDQAAWLAKLVPEIRGRLFDIAPSPAVPAERERDLVLNSAMLFLQRVAREQPLLLVAEDLHWADASTVHLLRCLARIAGKAPLLIVGTYRDDGEIGSGHPLAEALPELNRQAAALFVPLRALDEAGVGRMLSALAQDNPPPHVVSAIWRQTEGNPLFVQEFIRLLLEEHRLLDASGGWSPALDLAALDVPTGVRLVIGRRLSRLARPTRQALSTAAVMGRQFRYDILEDAADMESDALLRAIEEAERAQLLRSRPHGPHVLCTFGHELISQTLYRDLSLPRRQRLHRRVADVMELAYGSEREAHAAELAYHYSRSGTVDPDKPKRYLMLAGDQAMAASAFEEAAQHYQAAASFVRPDTSEHAQLLLKLGSAQLRGGASDEAAANLERAASMHERFGDSGAVEEACLALTWLQGWRGKFPELERSMQQGLRAAPDSISEARCRLLAIAGKWLTFGGQPTAADHAIESALAIATRRGDAGLRGTVLATKGGNQWVYTAFANAERTLREAADLLRAAGDLAALPLCRTDYVITLGYLGRLDDMDDPLLELSALAEKLGDPGSLAIHDLFRAILAFVRGELETAERWIRKGEASARRGVALVLPAILQLSGQIMFLTGDLERAETALAEGARLNAAMGHPPVRYIGPLSQAYIRAFSGDANGAHALLRDAPSPPTPGTPVSCLILDGMVAAAQVYLLLGEPARAAALYPGLCAAAARGAVYASVSYPLLQRVLGTIAARNHWCRRADRHYTAALRQAEQLRARNELAQTAHAYAEMLLRDSAAARRATGRALAARALDLYSDMGMPRHVERVRDLLPAAARRPRTGTRGRKSDAPTTRGDRRRRPRRDDDREGTAKAKRSRHHP
jgi:DNA-binding winged helix-turn-helix (wHTH) protein/tetratricopeptide (TPR) repeat protein